MSTENEVTVYVDGEAVTIDRMTFRERRDVRRLAVELSEEPETDEYSVDDAVMAMIAVAKRRKAPDFDAMAMLDETLGEYLTAPPTSPPSKTPARSAARTTARKPKTS